MGSIHQSDAGVVTKPSNFHSLWPLSDDSGQPNASQVQGVGPQNVGAVSVADVASRKRSGLEPVESVLKRRPASAAPPKRAKDDMTKVLKRGKPAMSTNAAASASR